MTKFIEQRVDELENQVAKLELIVHELRGKKSIEPSTTNTVEDKPLTLNQQRAAIIENAKEFIDKHDKGTHINIHDNAIIAYKLDTADFGISKCNPSDVFNEHIGKAIALGRALGLDVSEFEQAVQPNEVVVGHVTKGKYTGRIYNITEVRSHWEIIAKEHRGGQHTGMNDVIIINDTNAKYEVSSNE